MSKRTLDLTPIAGEMLKPKELIEVRGTGKFTLEDRRIYNALIQNAWGPKLGEAGHVFELSTAELRSLVGDNQRLKASLQTLQTTLVEVETDDRWQSSQLLGAVDLETTANRGTLRYSFPHNIAGMLKDSTIFAKLDLEVMRSFRSKYAFNLYEAVARRIRMKRFTEDIEVEELRNLLGVVEGKLKGFGNLNKFAIQPALTEVNAITPYNVTILPKKKGRKVVAFIMGWSVKSEEELKAAYTEMNRHSAGRGPRQTNSVEVME